MKTDGGPAFPIPAGGSITDGMTLRDWFAGQALPSAIQIQHMNVQQLTSAGFLKGVSDEEANEALLKGTALLAWKFADAMLATKGESS